MYPGETEEGQQGVYHANHKEVPVIAGALLQPAKVNEKKMLTNIPVESHVGDRHRFLPAPLSKPLLLARLRNMRLLSWLTV